MKEIQINRHTENLNNGVYTMFEIDVKNIDYNIDEDRILQETGLDDYTELQQYYDYNLETGAYTNYYANNCFVEIKNNLKFIRLTDWWFTGRTAGWFVLCSDKEYYDCDDELILENQEEIDLFQTDMAIIQNIVDKYIKGYCEHLEDCIIDDVRADLERENK